MIYIGIDPGVSGGLSAIWANGTPCVYDKMPATHRDVINWFETMLTATMEGTQYQARAVLERASASPQMGVVSAFTFGKGYGGLLMALSAVKIPFDEVTPQKWQQVMGCRSKGDKNVTKRRAQQLFPHVTITHAIADSLLLAEYCRRLHGKEAEGRAQQTNEARHEEEVSEETRPENDTRTADAVQGLARATHDPAPRHGAAQERTTRSLRRTGIGST